MKLRNETSWGELLKTSLAVIRVSSARISSAVGSVLATVAADVMCRTSAAAARSAACRRPSRRPPLRIRRLAHYALHVTKRGRSRKGTTISFQCPLTERPRSLPRQIKVPCNKFAPFGRVSNAPDADDGSINARALARLEPVRGLDDAAELRHPRGDPAKCSWLIFQNTLDRLSILSLIYLRTQVAFRNILIMPCECRGLRPRERKPPTARSCGRLSSPAAAADRDGGGRRSAPPYWQQREVWIRRNSATASSASLIRRSSIAICSMHFCRVSRSAWREARPFLASIIWAISASVNPSRCPLRMSARCC